ncbi:hypothetical protein PR001_g14540 [Phytophthora rubi]|uniref:Uncharacterized protein n=1 Tax=Phytophthora rubi TaxID=129364 RepID=A0A6A3LG29_9STRA|nr:hypothetical protein PR001_g14540 [Phytophthora rubi]
MFAVDGIPRSWDLAFLSCHLAFRSAEHNTLPPPARTHRRLSHISERYPTKTDLIDAVCQDVLNQKHEEAVNFYSKVYDFRQFICATSPAADGSVTVKMCFLSSERLRANNGTSVTVIDASQHGVFDSTEEALNDLTAGKRKAYIAQITVWDSKLKSGIVELLPPPNKRKAAHGSFKKNANAKAKTKAKEPTSSQDTEPDGESEDDEPEGDGDDGRDDDVSMDSETKVEEAVVAARTRSNNPLVVEDAQRWAPKSLHIRTQCRRL